jgi:hypothetical protein
MRRAYCFSTQEVRRLFLLGGLSPFQRVEPKSALIRGRLRGPNFSSPIAANLKTGDVLLITNVTQCSVFAKVRMSPLRRISK